jgi:Domain of unknown function DUF302
VSISHSSLTLSVEHFTISSTNTFESVRAKLETLAPRIDDGIFARLLSGDSTRALQELEALAPLTIFSQRDHGGLLAIAGARRRAIQYEIGNPLTASKMSRHKLSAALYAPIRVLLREDGDVAFEFDRPASVFAQFGNEDVYAVAQRLDRDLVALLEAAAS